MPGKGPFAPVEQAPIQDVRLVQESLPMSATEAGTGVFDAVAKGAQQGITLGTDHFERGKKDELRDNLDAVEQGLAAVRDPAVQQQIFDAAARGNPFFRKAKEEFIRITDAVSQGRLPGASAQLRTKAVLSNAITEIPEFADELRAEAKAALGFSPEAATFRNLLREPTPGEKTPEQKAADELRKQAVLTNRPMQEVQAANQQIAQNQLATSNLNLDLLQGEVTANSVISSANRQAANASLETYGMLQQMVVSGEGIEDPIRTSAAVSGIYDRIMQQTLATFPPTTDPGTISKFTQTLNDQKRTALAMIEDGSMQKLMTQKVDMVGSMVKSRMFENPIIASVWTAAGQEGMLSYINLAARYNTPAKWEAAKLAHPALAGFESIGEYGMELGKQIVNQQNGIQPETDRDRTLRSIYNGQVLRAPDAEFDAEAAEFAVTHMIEDIGSASTFEQYEDTKVLLNVKKSGKLATQFANILATNKADNTIALTDALSKPATQHIKLVLKDGQLQVSDGTTPGLIGEDIFDNEQLASTTAEDISHLGALKDAVKRSNNMLRIGKMYQGGGVVEFGTPESYLAEINKGTPAFAGKPPVEASPTKPGVRRYDPETKTFTVVEQ